ncbi:hypothetical protein K474DRAFT_1669921 [Panus rudis PR-1116 ss-1]|nr:hypothetical protein K474DRAFT_1669921 [Panus rudis PR-1116 ss-1]
MTSNQDLIASIRAHIMNTDGNWGTSKFRQGTLTSPVVALHFVAHTNEGNVGGEKGAPPTNHWTLFLELDDHRSSVRVEVAPNDPGQPGMVFLENKRYAFTVNTSHKVSAQAPSGTTVASVLKVIIDRGRDRYIFQPIGEGCRFWLFTLASDLAEVGILPAAAEAEVKAAIPFYWPDGASGTPVERPMVAGTFF